MADFVEAAKQDQPPQTGKSRLRVFLMAIDDHGFDLIRSWPEPAQE
jgi:hypothetical protein